MNKQDYKVSVLSSKLGVPLNFVVHTHLVTEHDGVINRYDVFAPFTLSKNHSPYLGVIFKNLLPPATGFLLWYQKKKWWQADAPLRRWETKVYSTVAGDEESCARTLWEFIEKGGLEQYPHQTQYRFVRGPNSNTFTQWVVDQFPECDLSLPWNAWGKGYKIKSR